MTAVRARRFGLDSSSEVPVAAHHAVGSSVALRYLSRTTAKVVTAAEHRHYQAAGIDLVLVFEDAGRPDRSDYAGGKADAEFAVKQATDILGSPPRPPRIRAAADYDPAGHPEATDAYFDGWAAVLPRAHCGPYGNDQMVGHAHARGFQTLWQTYAWSGGRFCSAPANSVYQYSNDHTVAGVGVDYDHIFGEDFGQWDYHAAAPVALDPHHYGRLTVEHYAWKGRKLPFERSTAVRYDQLRRHPHNPLHRSELAQLRSDLKDLADHVYFEAHGEQQWSSPVWGTGPRVPTWSAFHRGFRYQAMIKRAQGQVVVR
jgi:hypothetical protein